ncbi:hypothetical protein PIB30_077408 [Stylosanthes scabra]|uniref:OCEL domain-containing protein n=1 Tax=Stylosanthes scabra TaxID=79078 RepID=A0ABU6TSQ3_9FABA|nr:hypothetical protein [Stylosanthes scabra]
MESDGWTEPDLHASNASPAPFPSSPASVYVVVSFPGSRCASIVTACSLPSVAPAVYRLWSKLPPPPAISCTLSLILCSPKSSLFSDMASSPSLSSPPRRVTPEPKPDASEFVHTASSQETPPRYDPNGSPYRPLITEYDPSQWPPFPRLQPCSPEHKPASSPKAEAEAEAEAPPPYDPKGSPYRPLITEYDPSQWPTNIQPRSFQHIGELSKEERQEFLERARPLYLLAMEHYNDKLKEGEEKYQVTFSIQGEFNLCQGFCGFLRKMLWKAQPKSIEKIDPSATKYFCGAVHEISPIKRSYSFCASYTL